MKAFVTKLESIYSEYNCNWIMKNYYPLVTAHKHGVMICGSIGASIATGKPKRLPNDIDFVANSVEQALKFASDLHLKLSEYKMYFKVFHNSMTSFCPETCRYHIRFVSPMWLPICIFVVPTAKHWTYLGKILIQSPKQIKVAAESLSVRDNDERNYFEDEIKTYEYPVGGN